MRGPPKMNFDWRSGWLASKAALAANGICAGRNRQHGMLQCLRSTSPPKRMPQIQLRITNSLKSYVPFAFSNFCANWQNVVLAGAVSILKYNRRHCQKDTLRHYVCSVDRECSAISSLMKPSIISRYTARFRMKCNTYGPKGPEVINGQVLQSVEC